MIIIIIILHTIRYAHEAVASLCPHSIPEPPPRELRINQGGITKAPQDAHPSPSLVAIPRNREYQRAPYAFQ